MRLSKALQLLVEIDARGAGAAELGKHFDDGGLVSLDKQNDSAGSAGRRG